MTAAAGSGNRPQPLSLEMRVKVLEKDLERYFLSWVPIGAPINPFAIPVASTAVATIPHSNSRANTIGLENTGLAVKELRIRLAGFGGIQPGELFDQNLENAVKAFETDVMGKPTPTGVVDLAFATALDEFASRWPIPFTTKLRCPCGTCGGFGKRRYRGEYWSNKAENQEEMGNKYEYPGIHRSLLWGARALMHYCTQTYPDRIRYKLANSGYRCHDDNKLHVNATTQKPRSSTNHMGKAIDLWFDSKIGEVWKRTGGVDPTTMADADSVRELAQSKLNAQVRWADPDRFSLEPGGTGDGHAPGWVHLDVRMWGPASLDDQYFVKNAMALDGDPMAKLLVKPGTYA